MKHWSVIFLSIALAGCASAPPTESEAVSLFNDNLFSSPSEKIISAEQVLAISPRMKEFIQREIIPQAHDKGGEQALYDALYIQGGLRIDYDSIKTRTASEAFDAQSGNCLSMAIMTAALAKEMGLRVQFKQVQVEETWNRIGQTYFSIGHVNVTLVEKPPVFGMDVRRPMTIDFIPREELVHHRADVIEEDRVVAMYMNNRAAESLAEDKLDDAYAWARAAIRQDRNFLSPYNTLGVIYKAHGNLPQAEKALRQALSYKSDDVIAMSNLVQVLRAGGRMEEAQVLAERAERLQPDPPYHYFNLGMAAMQAEDYRKARSLFKKEIERSPGTHEFQFWFAIASLKLGDVETAKKHLVLAMANSTTQKERGLYAAKLNQLTSMQHAQGTTNRLQ